MSDLLALAERVEKATGPDRGLMCLAFKAVHPEISSGAWDAIDVWDAAYDRFCAMLDVGAHESAAVALVPEAWHFRVGRSSLYQGWANVYAKHPDFCLAEDEHFAKAATPALALTAAALRARAASTPSLNAEIAGMGEG